MTCLIKPKSFHIVGRSGWPAIGGDIQYRLEWYATSD